MQSFLIPAFLSAVERLLSAYPHMGLLQPQNSLLRGIPWVQVQLHYSSREPSISLFEHSSEKL
jgi:hypothetical protein